MALRSDEHVVPGEGVDERLINSPSVELHYNASDDLVRIVKLTAAGGRYERDIRDPDIEDYVVDRIVVMSPWVKSRGG